MCIHRAVWFIRIILKSLIHLLLTSPSMLVEIYLTSCPRASLSSTFPWFLQSKICNWVERSVIWRCFSTWTFTQSMSATPALIERCSLEVRWWGWMEGWMELCSLLLWWQRGSVRAESQVSTGLGVKVNSWHTSGCFSGLFLICAVRRITQNLSSHSCVVTLLAGYVMV